MKLLYEIVNDDVRVVNFAASENVKVRSAMFHIVTFINLL
jgi:hypothetical protein